MVSMNGGLDMRFSGIRRWEAPLLKPRGAARPSFAVWVDNAEILDPR